MSNQNSTHKDCASMRDIYFPRCLDKSADSIYLASFPDIVLLWPLMTVLLVSGIAQLVMGDLNPTLGWITVGTMFLNCLVMVQDFDQKKFFILLLLVLAAVLGIFLLDAYGFLFLQTFASWVLSFNPALNTSAYFLLGLSLLFLICWGLLVPLFSYWKFEQNEFIHYTRPVGKDMSISRVGCSIYKEVPDIFECFLLGGGGTIVIRKDNIVLANIRNVPFLNRRMRSIEEMLSETRVIIDNN